MKQLIIGIDGGDLELFNKFEMPFLRQLIESNTSIKLTEDLLSRGWAEIVTGNHARKTKAIYIMPKLDGTTDFTLSYSFNEMKKNNDKPFIWEFAEKKGLKVGVLNVPTTYPSPKVNGFFVSGAGGGLYKVDGIPDEMCSDNEVKKILEDEGYILELRFKPSGIEDGDELFSIMNRMLEKRFSAFTKLVEKKKVDFAFMAIRSVANLSYVLMYEIQKIGMSSDTKFQILLKQHFSILDNLLQELFTKLNPEDFIITADHGLTKQEYHANYNALLKELGYLNMKQNLNDYVKFILREFRRNIKNPLGFNYTQVEIGQIDFSKTKVFGKWYSNSLYVNDEKRFKGIVSVEKIDEIVDSVCQSINSTELAKKYKLNAFPYRRNYKEAKFYDYLPDIWIDAPDNIFFMPNSKRAITKSPWYKPIKSLKNIPSSMFTGTKGRHPICIMNKELADLITKDDNMDLTIIHKITERYFAKSE